MVSLELELYRNSVDDKIGSVVLCQDPSSTLGKSLFERMERSRLVIENPKSHILPSLRFQWEKGTFADCIKSARIQYQKDDSVTVPLGALFCSIDSLRKDNVYVSLENSTIQQE